MENADTLVKLEMDTFYQIINKHATDLSKNVKSADIYQEGTADNKDFVIHSYHEKDSQKFLCFPLDNGSFAITDKHSGKVAYPQYYKSGNDVVVSQISWDGNTMEQWYVFQESSTGYYYIKNAQTGKVFDVYAQQTADDKNIVQHDWHSQ
ncbi:RICIN domain-containing protein, partial [Bacillus wiedmannii]|uniref:RICIN domain-containing protein n=1 Tax=Bacillus wiedmannii TaxID=1890302 RepID=UPI0010BDAFC3